MEKCTIGFEKSMRKFFSAVVVVIHLYLPPRHEQDTFGKLTLKQIFEFDTTQHKFHCIHGKEKLRKSLNF